MEANRPDTDPGSPRLPDSIRPTSQRVAITVGYSRTSLGIPRASWTARSSGPPLGGATARAMPAITCGREPNLEAVP